MLHGIAIAPGVAVARAFRVDDALSRHDPQILDAAVLSDEVARFEAACAAVATDLDDTVNRVSSHIGESAADIFRAHRQLLRDPSFVAKVTHLILEDQLDARTALTLAFAEYAELFNRINDEYLRDRLADLRDVVHRIDSHLQNERPGQSPSRVEPVVLVAHEILPSHAVMFDRMKVIGIVTETGGTTGHAAILARSMGIAVVSGLTGLLTQVHNGDLICLDGREGVVVINPGPEVETAYRKFQREYFNLRDRLVENRDQEAVTKDEIRVDILANVNNANDARTAGQVGATGVGLYRTEYLFLTHHSVPTEDEQFLAYKSVIEAAPNKSVTIRTLDLGGDKMVSYFTHAREANPFMGWRSIRLTNDYPDFFRTQLQAILRAAKFGKVQVMFPMVSIVEEVLLIKQLFRSARDELARRREAFDGDIPVGIMIEVPAAAVCVDDLLDEADFVSVGSNDLIQYLMAADRDNPKVAHLCEPFTPAIYRLLQRVISSCVKRGVPITVCGEMAGRPRCVLPLFAMGLRSFSMTPAFVPNVKQVIRSLDRRVAREILDLVLPMRTTKEVKSYLTQAVTKLCPDVALFDTFE